MIFTASCIGCLIMIALGCLLMRGGKWWMRIAYIAAALIFLPWCFYYLRSLEQEQNAAAPVSQQTATSNRKATKKAAKKTATKGKQ